MKLHIHWGSEIDNAFRRRLERALRDLQVDFADAEAIDPVPDGPAVATLAVAAAQGSAQGVKCDLVVLGGPGEFAPAPGALRLDTADIENTTRRWTVFRDRLAEKLGRSSLIVAPEDLALQLDEATRRADEAEKARAEFELQLNTAARAARHAEAALATERAHAANLAQNVERLTALTESTAFPISSVPEHLRQTVGAARDHAWRARLAAAQGAEAADRHPDALAWPKAHAFYSGETQNRLPHGHGVIVFRRGAEEIARYAGRFIDGRRSGHGVATSDNGHVWCGEWREGEACGLGALETPDGCRFEGEVAPDANGAPRRVAGRGHMWQPGARAKKSPQPHHPVAPALPSPRAAGG